MHQAEHSPESPRSVPVRRWQSPLFLQQVWFIRLRGVAGVVVLAGGIVDWRWLGWYPRDPSIVAAGGSVGAISRGPGPMESDDE